jgi:hypothetical protein
MSDLLIDIVVITAIIIAGRAYYRSLDEKSNRKYDERDDGQLHLIYPKK